MKMFANVGESGFPMLQPSTCLYNFPLKVKVVPLVIDDMVDGFIQGDFSEQGCDIIGDNNFIFFNRLIVEFIRKIKCVLNSVMILCEWC